MLIIAASHLKGPLSFSEKRVLFAPPPMLEYFSFGFQMPIADSLWIQAIQDFDYCENQIGQNLCRGNDWLAKMLDTITNLAPDYQNAYFSGGLALTVLVSDYPGASKIFDKGVALFPHDKKLLYVSGYHAMIEEKNNEKAAKLFVQAAQSGGPDWLYVLATSLYKKAGRLELGEKLYEEIENLDLPPAMLKYIRKKLQSEK